MHMQRRYARKFIPPEEDGIAGYTSFRQVCEDLDGIVNVVWLSGTRGCF